METIAAALGAEDLVDIPAVFDAVGGNGRLVDGGTTLEGVGHGWGTLGGGLVPRGRALAVPRGQ